MRRTITVFLGLICIISTPGQMTAVKFETDSFRSEISSLYKNLRLPGLSVAVVYKGKIVYRQTEGFADLEKKTPIQPDSIFPVASITKTFTSVMMMKYAEEGKINLDDHLLKYPFTRIGFSVMSISPDVKLRDVLSHTSEGTPGESFLYSGGRYNYVYGVFEKVSGEQTIPNAFSQELQKNIITPLKLKSTLSGFPADASDPVFSRVVTPYRYDKEKGFMADTGAQSSRTSFPAAGILTDIDDLAAFTNALDENSLISAESYKKMTTPRKNTAGQTMPYALGIFSENHDGVEYHWGYGLDDSFSALFVRVPEKNLTFILLCNASFTAGSLRLGQGNLVQSPFALSFIKHFVLNGRIKLHEIDYDSDIESIRKDLLKVKGVTGDSIYFNELFSQALIRRYIETKFGEGQGKSEKLLELLYELKPAAFDQYNTSMIYLLSNLHDKRLSAAADRAISAYKRSGRFHAEAINDIILYYRGIDQEAKALGFYHQLADSEGFGERRWVIDACAYLGKYYLSRDAAKGRKYLWKAITYAKLAKQSDAFIENLIQELDKPVARS